LSSAGREFPAPFADAPYGHRTPNVLLDNGSAQILTTKGLVMKYFRNVVELIGNTPLLRLAQVWSRAKMIGLFRN